MRYLALAADYDGTLAYQGKVADRTVRAIERLVASGRKLILVTGRLLPDLLDIFPSVCLCERVVAENGAVLYHPATKEIRLLAPPPIPAFVAELHRRKVEHLSVGETIIATRSPYENVVLDVIRLLGLELRIVFNKGAVMILPAGIDKASGLAAALTESALSPHNTVGIGDGENDHALLNFCEYSAAVQNAVATLKDTADRTTAGNQGEGVIEIIDDLLHDDLVSADRSVSRHDILLGSRDTGEKVMLNPARQRLLLAGTSGSGKSTLATGLLERLRERGYQCCVIDPEGDYEKLPQAIMFGTAKQGPTADEVLTALATPGHHVVVNLVGLSIQDRPAFFLELLPRIQELGAKIGRPHWMLLDETHHLLPAKWNPASLIFSHKLSSMIYITVHPDQIDRSILDSVDRVIALGEKPEQTIRNYCRSIRKPAPKINVPVLGPGQALIWTRTTDEPPFIMQIAPAAMERRRHRRKYAEGELSPDRSFYFRGPSRHLNLRAQNLLLFMQLGEGVDDATWLHHLRKHHYSEWMAKAIKDESLANAVRHIENQQNLSPTKSRQLIRSTIEERYTVPATGHNQGSS